MAEFNLQRFIAAQAPVYAQVLTELNAGRKMSHWMWFVFPQWIGLGHSATANFYAIRSLAEATAYLNHDILGARLKHCTELVASLQDLAIDSIFGSPDDLKFRSSMTLFAHITLVNSIFNRKLKQRFNNDGDEATLRLINMTAHHK